MHALASPLSRNMEGLAKKSGRSRPPKSVQEEDSYHVLHSPSLKGHSTKTRGPLRFSEIWQALSISLDYWFTKFVQEAANKNAVQRKLVVQSINAVLMRLLNWLITS